LTGKTSLATKLGIPGTPSSTLTLVLGLPTRSRKRPIYFSRTLFIFPTILQIQHGTIFVFQCTTSLLLKKRIPKITRFISIFQFFHLRYRKSMNAELKGFGKANAVNPGRVIYETLRQTEQRERREKRAKAGQEP
jgi:hypothetical protein